MQKGDKVKFNRTVITILLGIADGYGVVEHVDGDKVIAIYMDPETGYKIPYVLGREDVEMCEVEEE